MRLCKRAQLPGLPANQAAERLFPGIRLGRGAHHLEHAAQIAFRPLGIRALSRKPRALAYHEPFRKRQAMLHAVREQLGGTSEIDFLEPVFCRRAVERDLAGGRAPEAIRRDEAHALDGRVREDLVGDLRKYRVVDLQHGKRVRALRGAVQRHRRDVDAVFCKASGDMREDAGDIHLVHDHRVELPRDVHVDAVDARELGSSPNRHAARLDGRSPLRLRPDVDRVGMPGIRVEIVLELDGHPGLARQIERLADARVIGMQAEDAGDERLVGAVPAACAREGPVEREAHAPRLAVEEVAHHRGDVERAGRVRRRRPDHDGADDVSERQWSHAGCFSSCYPCRRVYLLSALYSNAAARESVTEPGA